MKTIEITDELYDSLIKLAKEFKTQDNRGTANVFFQIQETKYIPAYDGCSDMYMLYSSEYETEFNNENDIEEIKDYCIDHYEGDDKDDYFSKFTDDDYCDYLIDNLGFVRYPIQEQKVLSNAFITAKECDRHIKANAHHYSADAVSYGSCAWRNNDFEIIHKLLNQISI